mgnify:CR=1 FL=1
MGDSTRYVLHIVLIFERWQQTDWNVRQPAPELEYGSHFRAENDSTKGTIAHLVALEDGWIDLC